MNRRTSHGQAIRSTLAFLRVTHFIPQLPVVEMSCRRNVVAPRISTVVVVLAVLPLAIEVAFILLTVAMLADWLSHRERRRGYLALAFGSLTLLVLIAPNLSQSGA